MGEAVARLVGQSPPLDAVELDVYPPDAGDAHQSPYCHFAYDHGQGKKIEEEEEDDNICKEEREAEEKNDEVGYSRYKSERC